MQTIRLGNSDIVSSRLAYGCMRIAGDGGLDDKARGRRAVCAAIDAGYTLFDHADIYADGAAESLFGEVLAESPGLRDSIILQSKCGVRREEQSFYDNSGDHILQSVDGSLRRLGVDRLDVLLLHRPDALIDFEDVAAAFERLHADGKVTVFGVSNFPVSTFDALQRVLPMPLAINQIEINLHRVAPFFDGTLDYCQSRGVTAQGWCPLAGMVWEAWGNTLDKAQQRRVQQEIARQTAIYETGVAELALAWLLRHPAGIVPIVGSTTVARIQAAVGALSLDYDRADWYRLLQAREGPLA